MRSGGGFPGGSGSTSMGRSQGGGTGAAAQKADPVKEAEAALKRLREATDPDARRQATEALQKAVEKLKQQKNEE